MLALLVVLPFLPPLEEKLPFFSSGLPLLLCWDITLANSLSSPQGPETLLLLMSPVFLAPYLLRLAACVTVVTQTAQISLTLK